MKLPSLIAFAGLSLLNGGGAFGADATTPVDYAQRNAPFAPSATVTPPKKELSRDETVQEKRFETPTVDKKSAALGDRRAAIEVGESRDKNVREKKSSRPQATEPTMNAFNHRAAGIATAAETKKPTLVAKYQDGLVAASASNMARFPALDGATAAKINRFVFRKNSPDSSTQALAPITGGAPVTPAGGPPGQK